MQKNGTILITGGTKGIGWAIAKKFLKEGWNAIICARSPLDEDKFAELSGSEKSKLKSFQLDVSKKEEVFNFAQELISKRVSVDILVNNAGVFEPGTVHGEADGILEKLIETNLYSAYHLSRKLIPTMLEKEEGHIFNMCSTASIIPYVNGGSYCISKFAMYGMSKLLREELKDKGIRITSILPGATYTDSWSSSGIKEDRFIKPEDIAESIWSIYNLSGGTVVEEVLIRPQLGDVDDE